MPVRKPLVVLSLGAGVQSSTLALMAAHGEITPMPDVAIFADTQAEPKSVYTWLDWLDKQLPFSVYRVTAGSLAKEALRVRLSKGGNYYTNSNIPVFIKNPTGREGLQSRQCTQNFKLDPINKLIRELGAEEIRNWRRHRKSGVKPITQWIGISRDEVVRMKPSRLDYIENTWPLVDRNMRRSDCLNWMSANGYPVPPRSACVFCPYHDSVEWSRLKLEEPDSFATAVKFEQDYQAALAQIPRIKGIPFLHRSCMPLSEVDFAVKQDAHPDLFGNECEGMCGV